MPPNSAGLPSATNILPGKPASFEGIPVGYKYKDGKFTWIVVNRNKFLDQITELDEIIFKQKTGYYKDPIYPPENQNIAALPFAFKMNIDNGLRGGRTRRNRNRNRKQRRSRIRRY